MKKFAVPFLVSFLCFSLMGCVPPSHLIRINESLPKNATIEKESVVVYAQRDCPGDCPLSDKDVEWHSATIYKNVRQIQTTVCQRKNGLRYLKTIPNAEKQKSRNTRIFKNGIFFTENFFQNK